MAEDVKEGQVWIHRKGGTIRKVQLTHEFYDRLSAFARERPGQKLFSFRERRSYNIVQNYAREAGLADWEKVHPHRFRHYFITHAHELFNDLPTTQQLAGHSSPMTTLRYIARKSPEWEKQKLEQLAGSR